MAGRDEIIAFCDELLASGEFDDYGPNGLQVPGAAEVELIVSGVSANLALIEAAVAAGSQMLIAHHGLFWDSQPRGLSAALTARLRPALAAGLNLAAWHLPLDAHPEIGNNALLCAGLGLTPEPGPGGRFGSAGGREIGIVGRAAGPLAPDELERRIGSLLEREPLLLGSGPERIERVGLLSGGGASFVGEAIGVGLDALVTGEPAEYVSAEAREGGIHFFAAGHHATERLGIRRLGEVIAERFGIEHRFVDVPNPI